MGEEKKNPVKVVEKLRIRTKGTFNYREIHNHIFDWLLKMGYAFAETKHAEKDKSTGREIESEWSAFRKVTGYVKYKITMNIMLKDYKEIVVEHNGDKIRTGTGKLEIVFNAEMEKNYEKQFSERKSEFTNFLKELYEKYLMKKRLEDLKDKLEKEVFSLYEGVKTLID